MIYQNKIFYKIIIDICLKLDKKEYIIHFFNIKNSDKSLIQIFYSIFIDNIFLSKDDSYEHVLNVYCKAKNIFNCLSRFSYLIKIKKALYYDIQTDLNFNELSIYPENQKIMILQNKTKYNFRLTDIINIIKENLFNSDGLFPTAIHPRNPYTNIRFTKIHLINIYIKLLNLKFDIPIIIKLFMICNFNVKILSYQYFEILKDNAITQFPDNCDNLMHEIIDMIEQLKENINFVFKPIYLSQIEISEFLNKLKSPLRLFLRSKYSSNPNVRNYNKKNILKVLNRIFKFNKFKCILKKNIDISNNIILRHNSSVLYQRVNLERPPPPPPLRVIENIRLRRLANPQPPPPLPPPLPPPPPLPSHPLPPLIIPLLTSQNIVNEEDVFRTVNNIARTPDRNRNNYRNLQLNLFL